MKHLKKFESFGMNKSNCDRCNQTTNNTTTMSMFNNDVICMNCKEKEKRHPNYQLACELEREALRNGDTNFPGAAHLWYEIN